MPLTLRGSWVGLVRSLNAAQSCDGLWEDKIPARKVRTHSQRCVTYEHDRTFSEDIKTVRQVIEEEKLLLEAPPEDMPLTT